MSSSHPYSLIGFHNVNNAVPEWLRLTWVQDGTCATLRRPGLWVECDTSSPNLHGRALVQDLLHLDFHLCVGTFIMS